MSPDLNASLKSPYLQSSDTENSFTEETVSSESFEDQSMLSKRAGDEMTQG